MFPTPSSSVVFYFNIPIPRHTDRSRIMYVYRSHVSHFLSSVFLSVLFFVLLQMRYLLRASISHQRMMTRKERSEYVYRCMLGQTLNDESSQESNPINCTKEHKSRKKKDGTVMAFFMSCEELTKSTQWINDIDICSKLGFN